MTENATDIHFEPQEGELAIRYRVDGLLVPVPVPENLLRFQDAIISRLKIMARMNISERRLPQDGRIDFRADGAALDIRVSTIPTIYAESVSLRLLNQRKMAYTMEGIGLTSVERAQIEKVPRLPARHHPRHRPHRLRQIHFAQRVSPQDQLADLRIVTIEDPIEYEVPGANQMQTHAEIGLTFASALRHVLRQDPDVIMVGEIRDLETAEIAIRASLTGHLVFSTLHTNDAPRRAHPPDRHGCRALPRRLRGRARNRAAPRAPTVPRLRQARAGQSRGTAHHAHLAAGPAGRGRRRCWNSPGPSAAAAAVRPVSAAASACSKSCNPSRCTI
ncbi:MAG: ATPase, T2SS/T4P/T4SS family [Lacunisphaera sp.]